MTLTPDILQISFAQNLSQKHVMKQQSLEQEMQRYTFRFPFLKIVSYSCYVGSSFRRVTDSFPGSCFQYVSFKWQKAQRNFFGTNSSLPVSFKKGQEISCKLSYRWTIICNLEFQIMGEVYAFMHGSEQIENLKNFLFFIRRAADIM